MSTGAAIALFVAGLALSALSSLVLSTTLDRTGARFDLSEGLLGIVTAVGADAPEIAAAVTALLAGRRDVGVGVVLGSNIFNVAVLLGLSATIAGGVHIHRRGLWFQGTMGLVATVIAVILVLGVVSGAVAFGVLLVVFLPYLFVSALGPRRLKTLMAPTRVAEFLSAAMAAQERDSRAPERPRRADRHDALTTLPALFSVVAGSIAMVRAAQTLGDRWHVPGVIVGTLVLATLTGVPNVLAAVRLARAGRGSAVVSETLNSNTANVLIGLCVPAMVGGLGAATGAVRLEAWWLLASTILALLLTGFRGRLRRSEGVIILLTYVGFVLAIVATQSVS